MSPQHYGKWIVDRYGAFLEAAPDAMLVVDHAGRILALNTHALALFGYGADELLGQPIEVLVPARLRGAHVGRRDAYTADPHTRPMGAGLDLQGLRKDGSEFSVEISLSPFEADGARLTIAAVRDSSMRRQMEARLRGLLEAAPDAMIVAGRDGRIRLVNSQTERLFGYPRDELLGQSIEILVPARFKHAHPTQRETYAQHPRPREMRAGLDLFGRRKDGTEFPAEISLSPLDTDEGMLITSAVRDITDRKRMEEDIRRQNRELEQQNRRVQEASRMKSEFLANMSHELRTPLNSIIGFGELLYDGTLGPVAENHREFLGDILTSARHLLHLINDVLDLSKVESGTMEFFPEPVDLEALAAEVRDMVRPLASKKGIRVDLDLDPSVSGVVADPAKFKQVLSNYLSNALKFTPDGGRVSVRTRPAGDEFFRLEVEDTGVGIREDDLGKLFVEFQQLDAGSTKKYQGTGLGLALTKRIVRAQGGQVGVSSTLGTGSVFFAELPRASLRVHVANESLAVAPERIFASSLLVVDDDPASLRLVDAALRQRGFRPTCTDDPAIALAAAAAHPPDLVILDLLMPALPGAEFLARFRATAAGATTPVIIWTVKDLSPVERVHLTKFAQVIISKRDGGVSALIECVLRLAAPDRRQP